MSEQVAKKFIDALWMLEDSKNAEPLAALYAEDAAIGNIIVPDKFSGKGGARDFWTEYRGTFGQAHSTFRNVIAANGSAALEWATEGTSLGGEPFTYAGITVLEIEGDQITRSSAYFDPQALGRQLTK